MVFDTNILGRWFVPEFMRDYREWRREMVDIQRDQYDIYRQIQSGTGVTYQRQAIAAVDENTKDCCLKVHGQVVDFDEKFHLTGTPRFAHYVHAPPFHWNCRTVEVLYLSTMEDFGVTTGEM